MINESKVLLDLKFKDSLHEGFFNVKITKHETNIVLGECVEVKIEHDTDPELCLNETYQPGKFPEDFYSDLFFRGWNWVSNVLTYYLNRQSLNKNAATKLARREP